MSTLHDLDPEFEGRVSALLLDVLIRAGLVLGLAMICFQVFSPFLSLMTWALILAVTLYPLHQSVAAKIGGRQGLAATLLVLLGIVVVVVPTAALMNSLGDSVHRLVNDVRNNTLQVPAPRAGVAEWPLVGERVASWRASLGPDALAVVVHDHARVAHPRLSAGLQPDVHAVRELVERTGRSGLRHAPSV